MTWTIVLIKQIPLIIWYSIKEYFFLKRIIKKEQIDVVISDNRFGLWSKKVYCIYITHQLFIKLPYSFRRLEFFIQSLHSFVILKFNECWIPDDSSHSFNFSGALSHYKNIPKT